MIPLQNTLIRGFSGLIFYLLLPLTMLFFAWKAAVFPAWGLGLLDRANLSGQWLVSNDLRGAYLSGANLFLANLSYADVSGANLVQANLSGANLSIAFLSYADLDDDLKGTRDLTRTQLGEACGAAFTKLPEGFEGFALKPCAP
jgi:uncharacterized protein YjbI with pentapeptide repeats